MPPNVDQLLRKENEISIQLLTYNKCIIGYGNANLCKINLKLQIFLVNKDITNSQFSQT